MRNYNADCSWEVLVVPDGRSREHFESASMKIKQPLPKLQPKGCLLHELALICNPEVANVNDQMEKRIELRAPISRVWRAITDYREFGEWFRVRLDGPFVVGQVSRGQITYPGCEHIKWEALVQKMEPERLFSFTWPHPKSLEKEGYPLDYSKEPRTLVEFRLEKTASGTLLVVTESGFDKLPGDRRLQAFRRNDGGWTEQMKNIENYVAQRP